MMLYNSDVHDICLVMHSLMRATKDIGSISETATLSDFKYFIRRRTSCGCASEIISARINRTFHIEPAYLSGGVDRVWICRRIQLNMVTVVRCTLSCSRMVDYSHHAIFVIFLFEFIYSLIITKKYVVSNTYSIQYNTVS